MSARLTTPPRRTPAATGLGIFVAALVIAIAVVAVHDLSASQGWSSGSTWLSLLSDSLDGLGPSVGLAVLGVVLSLVGLAVVILSLDRGRATHVAVLSDGVRVPTTSDLWLTPGAVGALAHELADRSAGVIATETTSTTHRRVVLTIEDQQHDTQVLSDVQATVDGQLGSLTPVKVVVRRTRPATPKPAKTKAKVSA